MEQSLPRTDVMNNGIAIIDRGRGPQLSTSRITVQDVVPYLQRQCTYEQIQEIMPVLSVEEIKVIEQYVRENYDAVMEQDRRIRERAEARRPPPEVEAAQQRERRERLEQFREVIRKQKQERNGDSAAR
jgi:hypothetical protein